SYPRRGRTGAATEVGRVKDVAGLRPRLEPRREGPVSEPNATAAAQPTGPRPLWPSWKRALGYARPYRGSVVAIVLMTLALGALGALEPLVLKGLFDALTSGAGAEAALHGLAMGIVGLAALTLLREALTGVSNWLTWRTRIAVHYDLLDATV